MMRNSYVVAVMILAAASGSASFAADPPTTAQKALQTDYDTRDRAVARRDLDATLALYAPDFVGISQTGRTHDLKEERADFLQTFALPAQSSVTQSTIQKLTLGKAGAEATVSLHRHGVLHLVDAQTHADSVLVLDGIYQDVWAKRTRVWLLTREQTVSVKATMNGRPL